MEPAVLNNPNEIGPSSLEVSAVDRAEDGVNLLDLLIVIAEHKKWIAKVTAGITMLAALSVFAMPNRYTARTRILPPQQNQSLAAALTGQLAAMGPLAAAAGKDLGLKNPNLLYVGMLKSETVENAIVQRFELTKVYRESRPSDAREDLDKAATITAGKEGFISISVEDRDPKRAAAMANAYVNQLQSLTQNVSVTEAGQRRLFFDLQVRRAKENLANAEQALKETQQKTGIIELEGQAKVIIDSVAQLRAQIAAKEVELHAMRSFGTERNPDVFVVNQELSGLKIQVRKMEQQQNAGSGDLQVPTGKIPELGLEYIRRSRDVKYCGSIFELLVKQYELAKLDEGRQGAVIQVIDPALEPDKKSSPMRVVIVMAAAVVALLGASSWVLLLGLVRQSREAQPKQEQRLARLKELLTHPR